jgi:hypothetical protein
MRPRASLRALRAAAASRVSHTGSVLAMQTAVAKPPRTAARHADSRVSLAGKPGSRKWA